MATFSWLTLADAQNELAARLADPLNVQWSTAELSLYIQDALRQYNCLTNFWKTSFSFSNAGPSVWINFSALPGSPRLRTVLDTDVYTMMEYMLLEPPTGGVWTGTPQFDIGDLQEALQNRRDEIIQVSNCNQSLISVPGMPNVRTYPLPDNVIEAQRCSYVDNPASPTVIAVSLAPGAAGNFTVAHLAPITPVFVVIQMTSNAGIWLQNPGFDATNLYLTASDASATGIAYVWLAAPDQIVPFTSSAGNFTVPHTLGMMPALVLIEVDSGGAVWFQGATAWDDYGAYLVGSDVGLTGRLAVWLETPDFTTSVYAEVPVTAGSTLSLKTATGLSATPTRIIVRMTSGGLISLQVPLSADAAYVYLSASDVGVTGVVELWVAIPPAGQTLTRDDTYAWEAFIEDVYQQESGTPAQWSVAEEPPLSFNTDVAPVDESTFSLLVLESGVQFSPPTPTLLGIPDDFAWLARWGALADLLGRESEATDRGRATWCQKRYEDGLKLLVATPWIMLGKINGAPADLPAFNELDNFAPEWDSSQTDLLGPWLPLAGVDTLAAPVGPGIVATVLGNAPFLDPTNTYVQVPRSAWDAVLSEAQFLASFKLGGSEFKSAQQLDQQFIEFCKSENQRLQKLGLFVDEVYSRSQGENLTMERQ
jgi:hypothetical protein